ncbi:hypothetical protein DFH06DRAFT_1302721 [Mycena polygramma]|nr:hypothetical protein DFH06DRAFT_1302721 [Mycena polygramma]
MEREILPTIGAFAVFTIDPVASLDPEVQQDPDAIAACKRLENKKYVVLVADQRSLYAPWAPYNSWMVLFISQGEPPAFPEKCIEPSMSLPISPMTKESYLSGRDPLKASRPLPWNDCYITCFSHAHLRSPTQFTTDPIEYMLDPEELDRHDRLLSADVQRKKHLLDAKMLEASTSGPVDSAVETSEPEFSAPHTDGPLSLPSSQHDGEYNENSGPSNERLHEKHTNPSASQGIITVDFTYDLSTVDGLADPADYFQELEAISRIEREAWTRIARAKVTAMKAMQDGALKDAAAYDDRTINLLVERSTFKSRISRIASKLMSRSRNLTDVINRFARHTHNK